MFFKLKKKYNFSVTKNGQPLDLFLYTWDERTRTFSTNEHDLVLDFSNIDRVTFKTGSGCTFKTGPYCTFDTGSNCTFETDSDCTFKTCKNCVVIRRDVFEIIKLEKEVNHIRLNGFKVSGYEEINKHKIVIDDKEIEISNESYENLKKQLL